MRGTLPRDRGPDARRALLVFCVAIIAYGWALLLPFQLDDYGQVPAAEVNLAYLAHAVRGDLARNLRAAPPSYFIFRPAVWVTYAAEQAVSGRPLQPWLFHATSVFLHGIVCVLLFLVLRRCLGRGGALAGALVFALAAAGSQAVSWVSARGDVLMTLFALASMLLVIRYARRPALVALLLAGVCAGLAPLSKLPGYVFVPLLAAALLLLPRGVGALRRVLPLVVLAAPVGLAALLRRTYQGSALPAYFDGRFPTLEDVPRMAEILPRYLVHLCSPWNANLEVAAQAPLLERLLGAHGSLVAPGVFVLLALLALLAAPGATARRILVVAAVLAALAAPALYMASTGPPDATPDFLVLSRASYAATLGLGLLAAISCDALLGSARVTRRSRRTALILLTLVLLLSGDTLVHRARTELVAGGLVRDRIAAVEEGLAENGRDTLVICLDPQPGFAGIPLIANLIKSGLRPPFRLQPASVQQVREMDDPRVADLLASHAGPVLILQLEGRRLVRRGPPLAPVPQRFPELEEDPRADAAGASWKPAASVPPRAVCAVRCTAWPGREAHVMVEARTDRGLVRRPLLPVPSDTGPPALQAFFGRELEWLLASSLQELRLVSAPGEAAPPPGLRPALVPWPSPPAFVEESVRRGLRLVPGDPSTAPFVEVRGLPPGLGARLLFRLSQRRRPVHADAYVFLPSDLHPDAAGVVRLPPSGSTRRPSGNPHVNFDNLAGWMHDVLLPHGITRMTCDLRVEVLSPDCQQVVGASSWSWLRLEIAGS